MDAHFFISTFELLAQAQEAVYFQKDPISDFIPTENIEG